MSGRATLFSLFPASVLALALAGCSQPQQDDPRSEIALVRVAVANSAGQPERGFTGVVSARVQSELGFRVAGKVIERLVDTGQAVKSGQALMRIDRSDFTLATTARTGAVAAARARALQTAADEKRYRGLVSAGAVSASAYDQARAAAESAQAELAAAQALADVARNEASYSVLLADADGIVVETLAEPGQVVAAGQTVVRLARSGPREATISLPETIRPKIGSAARATLYSAEATTGTAQLRQLSNAADPRTRTFEARYVLGGAAADAALGTTVTILLPDTRAGAALQVPLSAIFDAGKGPGVWIVTGQQPKVNWRPVKLAGLGEETAAISDGLKSGERFVALGAHLLHEGERVRFDGQAAAAPVATSTVTPAVTP
jgi:RND family efflux transporter MFP subunit